MSDIGPGQLHVLLEVPSWIAEGLASGYLRAFGGVIRRPDGTIAALLTEGRLMRDLIGQGQPIGPSDLSGAIGNVKVAGQMAAGLNLLNLGVSAAGFVVVARRLDAISDKLDRMTDMMIGIKGDTGLIKSLSTAGFRSERDSALKLAQRADRLQKSELFEQARTAAHKSRQNHIHLLADLVQNGRAFSHPEMFEDLFKATVLLTWVESRCDAWLEGPGQASVELSEAAGQLRGILVNYQKRITDFQADPRLMLSVSRELVAATVQNVRTLMDQLDGYVPQLQIQASSGITGDAWIDFVAPEGSQMLTCVVPADGLDGDLAKLRKTMPVS